jgi:hypothetical protein
MMRRKKRILKDEKGRKKQNFMNESDLWSIIITSAELACWFNIQSFATGSIFSKASRKVV